MRCGTAYAPAAAYRLDLLPPSPDLSIVRFSRLFVLILTIGAAISCALAVVGPRVVNPFDVSWITGDTATEYLARSFLRAASPGLAFRSVGQQYATEPSEQQKKKKSRHRRLGVARRRRLPPPRGPDQGADQPRRREDLAARGRGALLSHPAVAEAVAFALPDAKYGETVGGRRRAAAPTSAEASCAALRRAASPSFKVPARSSRRRRDPEGPDRQVQRRLAGRADRRGEDRGPRSGRDRRLRRRRPARGGADVAPRRARREPRGDARATACACCSPRGDFTAQRAGDRRPARDRAGRRRRARPEGPRLRGAGPLLAAAPRRRRRPSSRRRTASRGGTSTASAGRTRAAASRRSTRAARSRAAIAPERAIGCVVYCSTELEAPGVVRHIEGTRFSIGEPDGTISRALPRVQRGDGRRRPEVPGRARHPRTTSGSS